MDRSWVGAPTGTLDNPTVCLLLAALALVAIGCRLGWRVTPLPPGVPTLPAARG